MAISATLVKELRDRTGIGMMQCKEALKECDSDLEEAVDYLRKKGHDTAAKKSDRTTSQGRIGSYVHSDGRIAVLVQVNCESDFVAKNEEFQELIKDLCMHVAATDPVAVSREQMPEDLVEKEKEILREQIKNDPKNAKKPDNIIEKILTGRINKFFAEKCLLEQPFVKDSDMTVQELLTSKIAKLGENLNIGRFVRLEMER